MYRLIPKQSLRVFFPIFILAGFLLGKNTWAAESVGQAVEVAGQVLVTHEGDPKASPLELKANVVLKDVVETKKDGVVKITFKDGTDLVIRENSKILVSEFLFNPGKKQRQTIIDVTMGKVRAIVSKTFDKKTSKTELKTPTAVVGVRGTDVALEVTKKATKVFCLKGVVETFNPSFPAQIIEVVAGNFTNVLFGKIPALPLAIPSEILDQIENQFGFPTSIESLKEMGKEELRKHVPIPGF